MTRIAMERNVDTNSSAHRYQRHKPESTLLYQLVARYNPAFKERMLGEAGLCLSMNSASLMIF